jgi:hypothetical protein
LNNLQADVTCQLNALLFSLQSTRTDLMRCDRAIPPE